MLSTVSAASSQDSLLRGNEEKPIERQHYIRRIYGPENAAVRRAVSELEERHPRFQTGLPANPNHVIDYKDHPYDKSNKERKLQDAGELYKPIRICHDTAALEAQRSADTAAQIDFINNEILPRMEDFWTMALSVVPISGNLVISADELDNRAYCGDSEFTEVPATHISQGVSDCDLMLYISGTPSTRYCDTSTLAVAVACNFDQVSVSCGDVVWLVHVLGYQSVLDVKVRGHSHLIAHTHFPSLLLSHSKVGPPYSWFDQLLFRYHQTE